MQKIKIAITGYTGLLGSYFYKKYKKQYQLIKVKYNFKNRKKIINYLKGKKIDAFLHLGALGRNLSKNKEKIYDTNYLIVKDLLQNINVKHFIFASSSHVYKNSISLINENYVLKPNNYYGKAKLLSEKEIIKSKKKYSILRIFNMYGKNQRRGYIIPDLISKLNAGRKYCLENVVRDFVHVSDVASALDFVIRNKIFGIYNISTGTPTSLKNLVYKLEKKLNLKSNITFKKSNSSIVGNNKKIIKVGFKFSRKFKKINLNF